MKDEVVEITNVYRGKRHHLSMAIAEFGETARRFEKLPELAPVRRALRRVEREVRRSGGHA